MSLSCERLDEICDDIRRNHHTTLPIVVESLLSNYIDHEDSKRLAERGPHIAELLATHPHAGDGVDQWAEDHTITACQGAAESLLLASRTEEWAASATNAKSAKLEVAEGWSLRDTARRLKQHSTPLWRVLEGVVKRPGVELNLDEAIGTRAGEADQAAGDVDGQVDVEYEATYKHESGAPSRNASILMIVGDPSSKRTRSS
jgi:hypothetical protein